MKILGWTLRIRAVSVKSPPRHPVPMLKVNNFDVKQTTSALKKIEFENLRLSLRWLIIWAAGWENCFTARVGRRANDLVCRFV
jgi:hypothetical protein